MDQAQANNELLVELQLKEAGQQGEEILREVVEALERLADDGREVGTLAQQPDLLAEHLYAKHILLPLLVTEVDLVEQAANEVQLCIMTVQLLQLSIARVVGLEHG